MILHKHHIIPKHAGGTDDKSNLVLCSVEVHAYFHRVRYLVHGNEYDKLAYEGLEGIVGKEEIVQRAINANINNPIRKQACLAGRAKWAKENPEELSRIASLAGLASHGFQDKAKKANLKWRKSIIVCPHCNKTGQAAGMMRWHFNQCKQKPTV